MRIHYPAIIIVMFATIATPCWATDSESAISHLENATAGITRAQLHQCVSTIRADTPPIDPIVWIRLQPVVKDNLVHIDVRKAALQLSCEKANDFVAHQILSLMNGWADGSDASGLPTQESARKKALLDRSSLVTTVVIDSASFLQVVLQDQQPLLTLLTQRQATQRLLANPAPIAQRRECAIEIISKMKQQTSPAHALIPLLDPSCQPALRGLVSSSANPLDFHYCAAATLAYLGDAGLLPLLESPCAAFQEVAPNCAAHLQHYIWLIGVQNPPTNLLTYIGSQQDMNLVPVRRHVAILRALELGINVTAIRDAILAHAVHYQDGQDFGPTHPLVMLKRVGVALNVLQASDLPNVPMPAGTSLPTVQYAELGEFPVLAASNQEVETSKPARQPWSKVGWQPNQANYPVLNQWMTTVEWAALPSSEAVELLESKLCELDLIPPDRCAHEGANDSEQ